MKKLNVRFNAILMFLVSTMLVSCNLNEDLEDTMATFDLTINGLEDLGDNYTYEGWIIVNGDAVTTGVFDVDANGNLSQNTFEVSEEDLENASTFVLTIEPYPDSDPAPSSVHILAGDFGTKSANLTIDHPAALNSDFNDAMGKYILATPTDGSDNNENSGIWFLDLSSGSPMTGLDLPTLPTGWAYEGWSVINGVPVSTGTYTSVTGMDDAAPFSGTMDGPPFPGEDFLNNAPNDLSFPTNLQGTTAVISIEPVPDNSTAPFLLKPLVGNVPANAQDHVTYDLGQNLSFPTGTAKR